MATTDKNRGDSLSIKVIVDNSIALSDINDLVISLGDSGLTAKKSVSGELTQVSNSFIWEIKADDTAYLSGIHAVTVSANINGYGERKTFEDTAPKINFVPNNNKQTSTALSPDFFDVIINLNLVTGTLTESQYLFNWFANVQTITITNKQDGDIISHNLNGRVTGEFFDSDYEYDERVSIEYVSDSTIRFKTSVFADILDTPFNGFLRCTRI